MNSFFFFYPLLCLDNAYSHVVLLDLCKAIKPIYILFIVHTGCLFWEIKVGNAHNFMICATSKAPGNTIISRQVSPGAIIRQGCPASTPLTATTTLHRPPILQVWWRPFFSVNVHWEHCRKVVDFVLLCKSPTLTHECNVSTFDRKK